VSLSAQRPLIPVPHTLSPLLLPITSTLNLLPCTRTWHPPLPLINSHTKTQRPKQPRKLHLSHTACPQYTSTTFCQEHEEEEEEEEEEVDLRTRQRGERSSTRLPSCSVARHTVSASCLWHENAPPPQGMFDASREAGGVARRPAGDGA
jgi:hypothetical protein